MVIGPTKERKFRQSNIYLREWMIRVELEKRAKIYDGGPVKDLYKSPTTSTPIDNHSKAVAKTGVRNDFAINVAHLQSHYVC